jgi:hypothetical protein
VTLLDYSFFSDWWLEEDCAAADDCDGADMNLSGEVDMANLGMMCDYWLAAAGN